VALYLLGAIAFDRRVGVLAAVLLMVNPLYQTHARRAMSDIPAEAFILVSLAAALWAWTRLLAGRHGPSTWLVTMAAGACAGLAVLAKLSGALAMMVIAAWAVLAWILPTVPKGRKFAVAGMALIAAVVSFGTFVAMNPFLTAHPHTVRTLDAEVLSKTGFWGRCGAIVSHRMNVSKNEQTRESFKSYLLETPLDKLKSVSVQGYGRFGPLGPRRDDSRVRFAWAQDWGAVVWLPAVVAGGVWAFGRGRRQYNQGEPPTGWAVLAEGLVSFVVVTAYIPLAWDRYHLSIQPSSALLVAGISVAMLDHLLGGVSRVLGRN
jgi:4-amino-4-deoxy-L-arabinose transferase-like glycosyltransferase